MTGILFSALIPRYVSLEFRMSQGQWSYTFVLEKLK